MPNSIGDAVMTFTGDFTPLFSQMDDLPNKVNSKLAPANARLGQSFEDAGRRGASAFKETHGSLDLLSDQIGIRLPREIKNFLAGLGPVQGLLAAAFEGFAIAGVVAIIAEATEKVSKWTAETFIFTEAQRALNTELLSSNKAIADYNAQLDTLQRAYALIGLQGSAKTLQQGLFTAEDAKKAQAVANDISNEIFGLKRQMVTLPEAVTVANAAIKNLNQGLKDEDLKKLLLPDDTEKEQVVSALESIHAQLISKQKDFNQQLANLGRQQTVEQQQEDQRNRQQRIQGAQQTADALVQVELQTVLLRNAQLKVSYEEDAAAKKRADDQTYQNLIISLEQRRSLLLTQRQLETQGLEDAVASLRTNESQNAQAITEGDERIKAIQRQFAGDLAAIDAQIKTAEDKHQGDQLASLDDFLRKRRDLLLKSQDDTKKLLQSIGAAEIPQTNQQLLKAPDLIPLTEAGRKIDELLLSYRELRVSGVLPLEKALADQEIALKQVQIGYENSNISAADLSLAERAVLDTKIQLQSVQVAEYDGLIKSARARGEETSALQAQRNALSDQTVALQEQADASDKLMGRRESMLVSIQRGDLLINRFNRDLRSTNTTMRQFGEIASFVTNQFAQAWASAIAGAIQGQQSFGNALRQATSDVASQIAAQAALWAIFETAEGFAFLAHGDFVGATDSFTSAGYYAAVAGVAAGLAYATRPSRNTGGPEAPEQEQETGAAVQPAQQPVQTQNIQRLAAGAVVTKPTQVIVGDAPGGEAVIPLYDSRAKQWLLDGLANPPVPNVYIPKPSASSQDINHENVDRRINALADRVEDLISTPTVVNIHTNIEGIISDDKMAKVSSKISKMVQKGTARLVSSRAQRVVRRG